MAQRIAEATTDNTELNEIEIERLREAIALAQAAAGHTRPNPTVGCVIADAAGETIGRGFHRGAGLPHAEVEALEGVRLLRGADALRGVTAFVSLEPCNHHGRTPPCSLALIEAGVARVVFAARDPNPVAGGGAEALRAAGVTVSGPHLEDEARAVNRPFFSAVERGRPWVVAKWAMSLDGRIATRTGQSKWITGEEARARGHALRGRLDAIVVGSGTVLADDPQLTYRGRDSYPQPIRIVLDGRGRTPTNARVLGDGDTIIVTRASTPAEMREAWRDGGATVWTEEGDAIAMTPLLERLTRELEIQSVLIEGGGQILGSAFDARVVDEVAVFIAPIIIGGDAAAAPVGGLGVEDVGRALQLKGISTAAYRRDPDSSDADLLIQGEVVTR